MMRVTCSLKTYLTMQPKTWSARNRTAASHKVMTGIKTPHSIVSSYMFNMSGAAKFREKLYCFYSDELNAVIEAQTHKKSDTLGLTVYVYGLIRTWQW